MIGIVIGITILAIVAITHIAIDRSNRRIYKRR